MEKINVDPMSFLKTIHIEDDGGPKIQGLDTWKVTLDDFTILEEIGEGSFGKVYKIAKKDTGIVYALKKLNKRFLIRKKQLKYAIGECKVLSIMSHSFVLKLHFAF